MTRRARTDNPEAGLTGPEMFDAALETEAAFAQPVGGVALGVEGSGEEHHRIGGLAFEFEQRLLGIEDDRDMDTGGDEERRQRRGGFRREGILRPDDEGEGLAGGGLCPYRCLGEEEKIVAIGRDRPVDGDADETGIAERTLPAGDVVEASQGHPVQTLEPIGQQTEDEVAEERSARLHRQQEPTRGEGVGDLAEKAALGPVQDVACQDRVEAAFRQVGFVLDHGDAARQGEAGALGEAAIGLEHRKVRGDSTGDGGRLGRERPEPELKQAQGPVRRKVGPGAVEDTGDHIRGCTSAGATQDEGVESVLRQGGLAREVTVEEAGDDGTEIRREHQFGG